MYYLPLGGFACRAVLYKVGRGIQLTSAVPNMYIMCTSGITLPTSGIMHFRLPVLGNFSSQKFSRKLYFFIQFFKALLMSPQTPAGGGLCAALPPQLPFAN